MSTKKEKYNDRNYFFSRQYCKYLDLDIAQIMNFSLLSKVMSLICVQLNEHIYEKPNTKII